MTAHEASSSSSSKSKLWKYDVFLSFRGKDTRFGFTSHLRAALEARGYRVFIDENDLKRGEEIKGELLRVIEESTISIIVFSRRYADSSWCLDELVKIMECRDKPGRHVLPIFYHVDPSHVRKQDGDLAKAFQKHEKDIRVKQWREALTKAANLSGHHLNNGPEAEIIKKIIDENICGWLTSTNEFDVAKHIVGNISRVRPSPGPAVSDRGDQKSDPKDKDPLTLSLKLDYSSTFSGHHSQPQTHSENHSIPLEPQGSAVNDRGDQIAVPMEEDFLTPLSHNLDHSKTQGPAISDRGDQISDPMDNALVTHLSLSIHHREPQGPAVSDRGNQISDPMDEDPLIDQTSDPMDEDPLIRKHILE